MIALKHQYFPKSTIKVASENLATVFIVSPPVVPGITAFRFDDVFEKSLPTSLIR